MDKFAIGVLAVIFLVVCGVCGVVYHFETKPLTSFSAIGVLEDYEVNVLGVTHITLRQSITQYYTYNMGKNSYIAFDSSLMGQEVEIRYERNGVSYIRLLEK